jgi:hypothetical protein
MANYCMNEAMFDLPERPFVDKTMHALECKLPSGKMLGVFVHRRPIDEGKSLRDLVGANVALNDTRLSAYAVLDDVEASIGGQPGILVRTRWRHRGVMFYQLQAHVVCEGTHMIFAVSGPLDEQAVCDLTFDSIVESLSFRRD